MKERVLDLLTVLGVIAVSALVWLLVPVTA